MSYSDVLYKSMKKAYSRRKYHCDSCKFYEKYQEISFIHERGRCSKRKLSVFSIESCDSHTSRKNTYWWKFITEECPICGERNRVRERMTTPKPDDEKDRYEYSQVYDGCMKHKSI